MAWTEAQIADLRRLWAAGHSTSQIGTILGVSKNAVIGKAHRLNLPAQAHHRRPVDPRVDIGFRRKLAVPIGARVPDPREEVA